MSSAFTESVPGAAMATNFSSAIAMSAGNVASAVTTVPFVMRRSTLSAMSAPYLFLSRGSGSPRSTQPHFWRVARASSGVTTGSAKRSFHSQGLVASMMQRELKPRWSGWIAGSSGPLHARFVVLMSRSGSQRVVIAQRASEDDRVVPVVHRGDPDDRRRAFAARVIAQPFAVRPFAMPLDRIHEALDRDLGPCRDGKPGVLATHDLDRLAAHPAGPRQLRLPVREPLGARGHEEERVTADDDHDRAALLALEVFLADEAAVLAGTDPHAELVLGKDLAAIRSHVHPARVGIAQDVQPGGADEP